MDKLLSICVPTYNRHEKLTQLFNSFLKIVAENYQDIEVIVSDNSDEEVACQNEMIFNSCNISYYKNDYNLGFAGNVAQCYKKAEGDFIWIISDDDDIIVESFKNFFKWFRMNIDNLDGVIINYKGQDLFYNEFASNYPSRKSIQQYLDINVLPFVFLSSGIIRKNTRSLNDVVDHIASNLYFHVGLYAITLLGSERLYTYKEPLVHYNIGTDTTVTILRMLEDRERLQFYISKYYNCDTNRKGDNMSAFYSYMLELLLLAESGFHNIPNVSYERKKILELKSNYKLNKKGQVLLVYHTLPSFIRIPVFYLHVLLIKKPRTLNLISKCRMMMKRIKVNKEARYNG